MHTEEWTYPLRLEEGTMPLPLPVAIHPHDNGCIVINVPGYDGNIDGYADKYVKLAEFLVAQGIGAVIRSGNHPKPMEPFAQSCQNQLREIITKATQEGERICGSQQPRIFLMGFSAGASAIAAVAASFPQVAGILLMAPSTDAGYNAMKEGMHEYTGPAYVVVGEEDRVVRDFPTEVATWGPAGAARSCVVIPKCDHQFRGAQNGRYMSQAPLWAFGDVAPFPHPTAGTLLYK